MTIFNYTRVNAHLRITHKVTFGFDASRLKVTYSSGRL